MDTGDFSTPPTCCGDHETRIPAPRDRLATAATAASPPDQNSAASPATPTPFPWWKAVVSLWICYHVAGIVIAPATVPPSSDIVRNSWRLFGPYLQFLYLNHGFHFFAPDPGPSTIVRYSASLPNGRTVLGQIPDKETMVPRLLYHRHFMLTEFLAASDEMAPEVRSLHIRALARQIARRTGAESLSLTQVTHMLPAMEWCRAGLSLEDPQLYEEQPIGRFEWADF
ncbi:MAG: hypothetical protein ACK5Q5_08010 [Planctomycetaceae bacterium]